MRALATLALPVAAGAGYYLTVRGALTLDLGWGRRVRPLGPLTVAISAPVDTVFDVIAAPYLGRTPRAMATKLRVLDRGHDMAVAEHYTSIHGGRMTATTLESVTFDRPHLIGFRLLRGPVPHLTERFDLTTDGERTTLAYTGELGTDFGSLGGYWGDLVAASWEHAVRESLAEIRGEAERRTRARST